MLGRAKPCLQAQGSDVAGWVGEEETKEAAELGRAVQRYRHLEMVERAPALAF